MNILVYSVAVLLLGSVVLFVKSAFFNRRPQKFGLLLAVLALPLYALYYNDIPPLNDYDLRRMIEPLERLPYGTANSEFKSDPAPAVIIGIMMLVRITVLQRVAVRRRLQRVHDPIANFFSGATMVTLAAAVIVSEFALGWVGAVVMTIVFALVYLGALALIAALLEVTLEISKLFSVWVKRKIFTLGTMITRMASWVSSLSGRLVSRALIDRIRADTAEQESIFLAEQESQDRKLYEAWLKDRDRRLAARRRRGLPVRERDLMDTTGDLPAIPPERLPKVGPDAGPPTSVPATNPADPSSASASGDSGTTLDIVAPRDPADGQGEPAQAERGY